MTNFYETAAGKAFLNAVANRNAEMDKAAMSGEEIRPSRRVGCKCCDETLYRIGCDCGNDEARE